MKKAPLGQKRNQPNDSLSEIETDATSTPVKAKAKPKAVDDDIDVAGDENAGPSKKPAGKAKTASEMYQKASFDISAELHRELTSVAIATGACPKTA